MKKVRSHIKKGFSLVEAILAIATFGLIVVALTGAYLYGQEGTALAGHRARAILLADEGLEVVRNLRDEGSAGSFSTLVASTYGLATSSNQWELSGDDDTTGIFTRTITITDSGSNRKDVVSTVTWQQNPQREGSVSLTTHLTDWLRVFVEAGSRITHYNRESKVLRFSTCDTTPCVSSTWTNVDVDIDPGVDVGQFSSLALDGDRNKVTYYDETTKDLKYAECSSACSNSAGWTSVTVESSNDVGQYPSLALTASGNPRISYYDESNKNLRFAFCDSDCTNASNWTLVTVQSSGDVGQFTSLALNSSDNPRIAYYQENNKNLRFAFCDGSCGLSGNWTTTNAESSGDVGQYASLRLNDSGNPRIAYWSESSSALRYAYCDSNCGTSGNWVRVQVDNNGFVGEHNSLTLDGDKPRISYYDKDNKNLKYASCELLCNLSISWVSVTVDATGDVGQYTSIALSGTQPRISYYDESNKDLKYAACNLACISPVSWVVATIDDGLEVGEFSSINRAE